MSYFVAGFATNPSAIEDLESSFVDVVPPERRNDILRAEEGTSFLVSYGANRAIRDLVIHSKKTGSWLAILGTPLVKLLTENEREAFLDRFFDDPIDSTRNQIDGCFALLAYRAATDTFYAITDYDNTTPVFYAATPNGIYLSSHELPLARFLQSEIDPLGFSMTIHLRLTWGSHTRFKNVHKLLPCQIRTFRGVNKSFSEIYWRPSEETQWPDNLDDVINRWLELLKDSVRAFYDCSINKMVICDFTGGEDARLLLSQCHALEIPFFAMTDGSDGDIDVRVAREAARRTGFDLVIRPSRVISEEQLLNSATYISLMNDAYLDYFRSCSDYATSAANPLKNWEYVKLCGAPGGEVFRGSYYLRGKAIFPSRLSDFDYRFFTRMKYMLDFHPGLLCFSDNECKQTILTMVEESLEDVSGFPVGIKIDHLLRVFQTCNDGLIYKNPRHLPFATRAMTRSIYKIPPNLKRGSRLTRACTEILYPELAYVRTQKGVPTIKKTLPRTFLFVPEYVASAKGILSGAVSRLLKWTESNKPMYEWGRNAPAIHALLNRPPYANWFSSSRSMITGHLYRQHVVDSLLNDARAGASRYVPILGRIFNQELACRWVYRKK